MSKLVQCCIPSEPNADQSVTKSSQVLSLLFQLTVDCDPSLYDYIRVAFYEPRALFYCNFSFKLALVELCPMIYTITLAGIGAFP